jgi:outer membrane protein OmpA-like peptidoglycan-associated protein
MRIFPIICLLLLLELPVSFGQSSNLKLIEKGKFSKAEKKINKKLKKYPDDLIVNFSKAVLLSTKNYNKYDTEASYSIAQNIQQQFENTSDKKILKDFEESSITENSINELTLSICRKAKEDAIQSNNLEKLQRYLSFYSQADQADKLQVETKRNEVAFKIACEKNAIASYQDFIDKYPKAVQISEAISRRNELAFNQAKEKDNIEAYKEFVTKYPKASQIQDAWNRIHELAFTYAKTQNTSKAYKQFMSEYPNSTQYNEAFKLYEKQIFIENTSPGNWISYKEFIINFSHNSWGSIAEDSIFQIAKRDEDIDALQYCANNFKRTKRQEAIIALHDIYTLDGENKTLNEFYKSYDDDFLNDLKLKDYELAILGDSLELHLPYQASKKSLYGRYIKLAAPNEKAFVTLQRIISPYVKAKDWNNAVLEVKSYEIFFQNRMKQVSDLISTLEKLLDNSIKVNSIGNTVNSNYAKEYSPIISADDKSLFFCGKDRKDNSGGEDVFVSKRIGTKWGNAQLVSELSDQENNNAPLCISADGNEMLLFDDGEIFSSQKESKGWMDPYRLGSAINTEYWEGDAVLSSDGNNILFVRSLQKFEAKYDIVFLIDATGSMQPCINGVKDNIESFISNLSEDNTRIVDWRAKIIAYRDVNTDYNSYEDGYFTSDKNNLKSQLSNVIASGGGDEPESTVESIHKAITESEWRTDASVAKVVVCFTDATNNDLISSAYKSKKGNINATHITKELNKNKSLNLFLFGNEDNDYTIIDDASNAYVTQYSNAVYELQNADYSIIMNSLSEKISLLANNVPIYHGDKQLNGDIYISTRNRHGNWSRAVSIGSTINTKYSERSPFLHPDMKTLYFSSDGHGGLGKLDVYKSTRLYDSCWNCWSEPVNMGKEINTVESDWGYKISTDGEKGYFAKKAEGSKHEDIFYVNIPPYLRPGFVATISGKLYNTKNEPISADMRWEDLTNGDIIGQSKSDPTDGSYFIVLPMGKIYGYYVDKDDHFPLSNNIDLRDSSKPIDIEEDINLLSFKEMIDEGIAVPINNLFFDFGKYQLLPYSIPELKRVATIIKSNNLKVEISGHTDNVGDDKSNLYLSEQRAKSVKDFLINEGCDSSLLTIVGFGETQPKETNETEKGRAKNRRVELKIIK